MPLKIIPCSPFAKCIEFPPSPYGFCTQHGVRLYLENDQGDVSCHFCISDAEQAKQKRILDGYLEAIRVNS